VDSELQALASGLRGPWAGLLGRCRKPRRERTFVEIQGPGSVEPHEPSVGGPKCRLDTRAHLTLVGFRRDEYRTERGVVAREIHCIVVGPGARTVVLGSTTERSRDCGPYGSWICSRFKRDGCFVNVGDALGCHRSSAPDLMVVGELAACDGAGVEGWLIRRGRVARLGCPVRLLVIGVILDSTSTSISCESGASDGVSLSTASLLMSPLDSFFGGRVAVRDPQGRRHAAGLAPLPRILFSECAPAVGE
jgi:hypothetical protein